MDLPLSRNVQEKRPRRHHHINEDQVIKTNKITQEQDTDRGGKDQEQNPNIQGG